MLFARTLVAAEGRSEERSDEAGLRYLLLYLLIGGEDADRSRAAAVTMSFLPEPWLPVAEASYAHGGIGETGSRQTRAGPRLRREVG